MNCTGKRCIMQYDKVDPATCPCVSYCLQATPPKTNADRIRSMSDEELADNFSLWCCKSKTDDSYCKSFGTCDKCWIDWLKQEAEEGE